MVGFVGHWGHKVCEIFHSPRPKEQRFFVAKKLKLERDVPVPERLTTHWQVIRVSAMQNITNQPLSLLIPQQSSTKLVLLARILTSLDCSKSILRCGSHRRGLPPRVVCVCTWGKS